MLGLPVGGGGGPHVEKLAKQGDPKSVQMNIPMTHRKDCDFSYAGLKSSVRRKAELLAEERNVETILDLPMEDKANIAASFQHVAIRHIEQRLKRAILALSKSKDANDAAISTLAVVGGVAANQELRSRLETLCATVDPNKEWQMVVPPPRLCTDQGAMSAWAGVERLLVGSSDVPDTQEVYARYPFSIVDT